jgi:parallel beta-helix repeat protein
MATLYVDFTNGNDSNDGTSFANRVKTITSGITAARTAPGDVIRIMKSEDPVSLGITATWTNKSATVTLASALTATIDLCESSWTAATDVTCTTSTTRKEGSNSASIAPAGAFTTGKLAYKDLGASTDFSAYQKVTLWVRSSIALQSGDLEVRLCSDTSGNTAVNTLAINEAFTANNWRPITLNNGGALGSNIRTVALYATRDFGAATILVDDILAANDLTLTCLISKESSATSKDFYPIQSINGTTIKLDYAPDSSAADTVRGYYGTTESVTTYKREPIRIASGQTTNEGGTDTARSLYTGGWDTTDMTTQNGLTFIDKGDDAVAVISVNHSYIDLERIVTVRGNSGIGLTFDCSVTNCGVICKGNPAGTTGGITLSVNCIARDCIAQNSNGYGIALNTSSKSLVENCIVRNNQSSGIAGTTNGANQVVVIDSTFDNNGLDGVAASNCSAKFINITARDNEAYGIRAQVGGYAEVNKLTTSGNTSGGASANIGHLKIHNYSCSEGVVNSVNYSRVEISAYNGDTNDMRIYEGNGTTVVAQYDTSTVYGTTSRSIKHRPVSVHTADLPFIQRLGAFAVNDSGTVTITCQVRRANASATGAMLRVRKGQNAGISSDLTDSASAGNNTWEELSVSFTSSEKTLIEVELVSWYISATADIFWGNVQVSQT